MVQRFVNSLFSLFLLSFELPKSSCSFSSDNTKSIGFVSRRDWWKVPVGLGTLCYGKLVGDTVSRLSRGIVYPPDHEKRIESVIETCLRSAASRSALKDKKTLQILEVGIGVDARLVRRNLYKRGIQDVANDRLVKQVELNGIDLHRVKPDAERDAKAILNQIGTETGVDISFQSMVGDISSIPFPDGYFDVVISCLTLCSVADQATALNEIQRVLRTNGGTFGYVEHVAASEEPYRFLEWQQQALDPLQQFFAENCHLHRYTEQVIYDVFDVNVSPRSNGALPKARSLQHERFLVDDMWPVSCQTCGAIQRIA